MGIVDHRNGDDWVILRRSDADQGRHVTSVSSWQGLAGCRRAADAEPLYLAVAAGAFPLYHFQNVARRTHRLPRDGTRLHRVSQGLILLPVSAHRFDAVMRGDPGAAVDHGGRRGVPLDCCDLERLPGLHGSQLHISQSQCFMHE